MLAMSAPRRQSPVLHLTCPPQTDMLHLIRKIVATVSREVGFSPEDASLIEISVDEACTNVIRHAYGDLCAGAPGARTEDPLLRLEICPDCDRLAISVIDRGASAPDGRFRSVSSLEEYIAQPHPRGLGYYIITKFMDEVAYDSPPGRGTVLSMVKYLHQPSAA